MMDNGDMGGPFARPGIVIIAGAPKTGTSSVVLLANSHPEVFVLFEAPLLADLVTPWARQFIETFPETRHLFRSRQDPDAAYRDLADLLARRGFCYRWIGVKFPCIDRQPVDLKSDASVIYCTRDVRTWLAKAAVQTRYVTSPDVTPAASAYTAALIESFDLPKVLHVTTEDLIGDNPGVQRRVAGFLGLDRAEPSSYWDDADPTRPGDPKAAINWRSAHPSSVQRPHRLDAGATIKNGPLWSELLPVFDTYHAAAAGRRPVPDRDKRRRDLDLVVDLPRRFHVPLAEAFRLISEQTPQTPQTPRFRVAGAHVRAALRTLARGTSSRG